MTIYIKGKGTAITLNVTSKFPTNYFQAKDFWSFITEFRMFLEKLEVTVEKGLILKVSSVFYMINFDICSCCMRRIRSISTNLFFLSK